jgi:hypothetical protein
MHFCIDEARMLAYVFLTFLGLKGYMLRIGSHKREAQPNIEADARNVEYAKLMVAEKKQENI